MDPIESEAAAPFPVLPDLRHRGSRVLLRYWETIRGERRLPTRGDLDLRKITEIVPWLCILERNPVCQAYRWRLAGTGICLLFGRDLTGGDFLEEWRERERPLLGGILDQLIATLQPFIALSHAISIDGNGVKLEILGVPIRSSASNQVQILGAILPLEDPRWLGHVPLDGLALQNAKLIWTVPIPGAPAGPLGSDSTPDEPGNPVFTLIQGGRREA